MITKNELFDAVGAMDDRYLLEAAQALGLGQTRVRPRRLLWRTLLIAAALTALMTATAYAAGLFGLSARRIELPAETGAVTYTILSPNGLEGSDTYRGTAAWWTWLRAYQAEHPDYPKNFDLAFARGDDAYRSTCRLYGAYDKEVADQLYALAKQYGLKLYTDSVFAMNEEDFYALSGCEPYLGEANGGIAYGYVFADGSFKNEGGLLLDGQRLDYTLHRVATGSLYPYQSGGLWSDEPYEEWEYTTARGDAVDLVCFEGLGGRIFYVSPDGRLYVDLALSPAELDRTALEKIADLMDFDAVCRTGSAAKKAIEVPRGAESNRDALQVMEDFAHSSVFRANKDFAAFFTATFYGSSFTGVHGQEGYADIDETLEALAEEYGLQYATAKTTGNDFSDEAQVYDNGAWCAPGRVGDGPNALAYTLHYIPKTALYTRLDKFADFADYARVWSYRTGSGDTVTLACEGPEKRSGAYVLYESDEAYVLMSCHNSLPHLMEQMADAIEWRDLT